MTFGILQTLNLLGALAFFIYGMKVMSEAIQRVAGSKMREILRSMTSNRYKGVFTGFLITSIIQSSSATTVLVVSFVNAGLLSLVESIGVIMGANIGTTITAWLISIVGFKVNISNYALPIIAIGFPLLFISRNKINAWGETLIGFALLFMGLQLLKDSMPDLNQNPEIFQFLSKYTNLGLLSTLFFILIGTVLTLVLQSSSATMALTLVMANNGWIPFEAAAAMVLGENIGTTVTANLAAIIANVHAKRAALSHLVFNVIGVIWMLFAFPFFLQGIEYYFISTGANSPFSDAHSIPIALSIFHTAFNLINTLLLLGFVTSIAQLVTRMIKTAGGDEFQLKHISVGLMDTSELSLEEAQKEAFQMGLQVKQMAADYHNLLDESKSDKAKKLINRLKKKEEITDRMEEEITKYLHSVSEGNLSNSSALRLVTILSIVDDLERIGDTYLHLTLDWENKENAANKISKKQKQNLLEVSQLTIDGIDLMLKNIAEKYENVKATPSIEIKKQVESLKEKLNKEHLKYMEKPGYEIKAGALYKDIFYSLEKVSDSTLGITMAISSENQEEIESVDVKRSKK